MVAPTKDAVELPPYSHSPIHTCVINNDLRELRRHLAPLPRLSPPSAIRTASEAARESVIADTVSAVVDRRDVPDGETPLHLAVRLYRPSIATALLSAGADPSLQNSSGWNPYQESILLGQPKSFSHLILLHHRFSSLQKWRRRLPSILAAMRNIRDFYLEIGFRFESPVIPPFVLSRALPSDTYKVWKRGGRIRVDATLDGFDGLWVSRSRRSFLFLGDANGGGEGALENGTLLEVNHDRKEIKDMLREDSWKEDTDEGLLDEAATEKVFRPGVDVTKAELVGRTNWRRKEKVEMVGEWKTKVYEIRNVLCTIKTKQPVPGGAVVERMPDLVISDDEDDDGFLVAELPPPRRNSVCAAPSRRSSAEHSQRKDGKLGNGEGFEWDFTDGGDDARSVKGLVPPRHSCVEFSRPRRRRSVGGKCGESRKESDDGGIEWDLTAVEEELPTAEKAALRPRKSSYEPRWRQNRKVEDGVFLSGEEEKLRKMGIDVPQGQLGEWERFSNGGQRGGRFEHRKVSREKEMKRNLRPTVWLTEDFPLKTEEVIPLLDVIANKIKAALRLRELLTTKFPAGTFPVKLAIPIVASVRVVVNFTKFIELPPPSEQFFTPPATPPEVGDDDQREKSGHASRSSWLRWGGGSSPPKPSSRSKSVTPSPAACDGADPFAIPSGYTWVGGGSKSRKKKPRSMKETEQKATDVDPTDVTANCA